MSMRLFRHLLTQVGVTVGTDRVIGGMDIPSECVLNNVWGEVHCISEDVLFPSAVMYGVRGLTVLRRDVDTLQTYDNLWDTMVPKDTELAAGGFELSGAANTDPEFEPGEPDAAKILDLHLYNDDMEWFKRRKLVTFATSKGGFIDATPDTFHATDFFKVRSRKRQAMEVTGAAMLGFSSPNLNDTTSTDFGTLGSEQRIMSLKYFEVILEQAWMSLVGLTEAGAETPWIEAQGVVADFLEPDVHEDDAGRFLGQTWEVFATTTWDLTVPGRLNVKQMSIA